MAEAQHKQIHWQQGRDVLSSNKYMLESKIAADVSFLVGRPEGGAQEIKAHKYVLISRSPVFEAMFSAPWEDNPQATLRNIDVIDMSPEVIEEMLRYMYTDTVNLTVTLALGTLYAAHFYQIDGLLAKSIEFLHHNIEHATVFAILNQAELCSEKLLMAECMDFVTSKAKDLLMTPQFFNLSQDALEMVVKDDRLDVPSEELVYNACVQWATNKCQIEKREPTDELLREYLGSIIYHIRFPIMSEKEFMQISKDSNILTQDEIMEIFEAILGTLEKESKFDNSLRMNTIMALPTVRVNRLDPNKKYYYSSEDLTKVRYVPSPQDQKHVVNFEVNQECYLHAVGMFVNSSLYDLTLSLFDEKNTKLCTDVHKDVTAKKITAFSSDKKYVPCTTTALRMPVLLKPAVKYQLLAEVLKTNLAKAKEQSYSSGNSVTRESDKGLTVTFIKPPTKENWSNLLSGQIPFMEFKILKK